MKTSLVLTLFLLMTDLTHAVCVEGWTDLPPYYAYTPASDAKEYYFLGGKTTTTTEASDKKKLSVGRIYNDDEGSGQYKLIKRNTLVKTIQPEDLTVKDRLVLVEVGRPGQTQKYLKGIVGTDPADKLVTFSGQGTRGFIPVEALKASSKKDILMVTKDTPLLLAGDDMVRLTLKYGDGLKPVQDKNQFKVTNCDGKLSYIFELTSSDRSRQGQQVFVEDPSCLDQQLLDQDAFQSVSGFLTFLSKRPDKPKIEVNDWGLVRLPPDASGKYVHFTGVDPDGSDNWAKPDTACELMNIAEDWSKQCKTTTGSCALQIGDLSFLSPTNLHSGKDPLGHRQHADGTCIDMRPFRNDKKSERVSLVDNPADYNKSMTTEFIDFLKARGATPIYFNDPDTNTIKDRQCDLDNPKNDEGKGVLSCEGHSDHIHYCLKKPFVKGC